MLACIANSAMSFTFLLKIVVFSKPDLTMTLHQLKTEY